MPAHSPDRSAGLLRWLTAAQTGLLPTPPTPAQITRGLSLWLDAKRGSRHLEHSVEHRFTKPNHPWTNGQVERMNRTLKEATIRRYHYDSHPQLRQHLAAFLDAYNLTPFEAICKARADEPDRFRYDPTHLTSGLNT